MQSIIVGALLAASISFVLTLLWIKVAPRFKILDHPNARSLHQKPTVRGGGIAVVTTFTVMCLALKLLPLQIILPALAIAAIGFIDDIKAVSAKLRLIVHLGSSASFSPLFSIPTAWMINLTNFMDGIDGILGIQIIFFCFASAIITQNPQHALVLWILAGSMFGFYLLNFSPSRVFLGDVGSGWIGFLVAALIIHYQSDIPIITSLIIYSVFIADTGVTLVQRARQKLKLTEAHRSHAYQQLVQKGWGHTRVTLWVLIINLIWVLPCALYSLKINQPIYALLLTYTPLLIICMKLNAGFANRITKCVA